jgi:DNA mismatch repair ATPase MutS
MPTSRIISPLVSVIGPIVTGLAALVAVPIALLMFSIHRQRQRKRRIEHLKSEWGKESPRPRELATLSEFVQASPVPETAAANVIDDQTWSDLNMNAVFARVDRTLTTAGECMLYRILRTPLMRAEELERRRTTIGLFQSDATTREAVQVELLSVGRSNARGLVSLVWGDPPIREENAWIHSLLTILAIAALVGLVLGGGPLAALSAIMLFLINMAVHYRTKARLMGRLAALRQLGGMIDAASRIAQTHHPELKDYSAGLSRTARATRRIARRVALLTPEGSSTGDLIATLIEYISIYFLHEVRTFHATMSEIATHRAELQTLFNLVGELDAWQSVASFRAGLTGFTEPKFADDGPRLIVRDARHPLLDDAVPNSIEIHDCGIAVTGSNMSGKTTFLRTIGVTVLLAQTIVTCVAAEYRARMMRMIASMNESDDLIEGKSYYLAEAERLLSMVRASELEGVLLALIDEPLAGTNSPERLAASREILRYLAAHNGLVIASTHDVDLVSQLQANQQYEAYHFSDQADEQGIRFDYKLRTGLDYHGNAIKVLKFLGYPETIIGNAMASIAQSR